MGRGSSPVVQGGVTPGVVVVGQGYLDRVQVLVQACRDARQAYRYYASFVVQGSEEDAK
jgi:hypothetical protein